MRSFRKNYRFMRIVYSAFVNKALHRTGYRRSFSLLVPATILTMGVLYLSCTKKQNSLAAPRSANINIFNASHVYDSMIGTRKVYLSGYDTALFWPPSFGGYNDYEIPRGGRDATRLDHAVQYYSFTSGVQRVRFTDTSGTIVADSSLNFSAGVNYTLYLADDTTRLPPPNNFFRTGAFRLFCFPEEQTNTPGKVRLRYIDLTPDVDTLNGYFFTSAGGKFASSATPNALTYGTASSYYDFDTTGLVVGDRMLLRLFRKKDTANYLTQVAIPPTPGRTYTVLVFGNAAKFFCSYQVKQPDGTTKQKVIYYWPTMQGFCRSVY